MTRAAAYKLRARACSERCGLAMLTWSAYQLSSLAGVAAACLQRLPRQFWIQTGKTNGWTDGSTAALSLQRLPDWPFDYNIPVHRMLDRRFCHAATDRRCPATSASKHLDWALCRSRRYLQAPGRATWGRVGASHVGAVSTTTAAACWRQ